MPVDTRPNESGETLLQKENIFRVIFDHSALGIAVLNVDGRVIQSNPALQRLLGYTEAELCEKYFIEFTHPDNVPVAVKDFEALLAGRDGEYQAERRYLRKDGGEVSVRLTISAIRDPAGKTQSAVVMVEDITEHKKAQAWLCQLSRVFEQSPVSIVVTDKTGRIEHVNPKFREVTGYSASEVLGKNPRILKSGETSPERYKQLWESITSGKEWRGEFHNRKKNGELYWELAAISPIFDEAGNVTHFLAVKEDITKRKQAEEKIREQAALLDEATDAIWVIDSNRHISYWNKGAERIYGWSAAEAVGKNPVDLLFKGIKTPQLQECIQTVDERGKWNGELEEFTKDGKTIVTQARCNAIRDEQGRRKSVLIINTDITERKKLESQFLRSQRMESIGTLAGGIAHDLNNVLAPLLFSVQLLRHKVCDDEGQKMLDTLESSVLRGAKLVKQVLAFGRGVKGERMAVQLDLVVRELEQIICETFPKSVEFEKQFPAGLWSVTGDATQLYQVLLNLCVNARDAMPNGGRLSIKMENVVLDEIYAGLNLDAKPGSYVAVKVTDTGTGIPKEIQDRMFEPFFTTKGPGKGTGLGLSTCLGIIKSHGGFINCYSEPGKGSAFKVYLPAITTPAGVDHLATKEACLPCGHNELVLVVDDEKAIRGVVQKTLEHFGYRVLTAENGAEAVSIYQQQRDKIDVVVIDMAMPVMDGHTATTALKAINPKIKIIGASGMDPGATAKSTDVGRPFIPKPYAAEVLLQTLHQVLTPKQTT